MRLVNKQGHTVNVGDIIHDFRNEAAIIIDVEEPRHAGSTGRVVVKEMSDRGLTVGYYPSVYNLEWSEL